MGPSDDEDEDTNEPIREGVGQFASMLPVQTPVIWPAGGASNGAPVPVHIDEAPAQDALPVAFTGSKKKGKSRRKGKGKANHPAQPSQSSKPNSKWADKCMYAELLEMTEDVAMSGFGNTISDGLPSDLETGWVAVTPVPMGKRCLAITHAPSGIAGISE